MSVETVGALERGTRRTPYRETVHLLVDALALNDDDRAEFIAAADAERRRGRAAQQPEGEPEIRRPPNNLPLQTASVVGRERDIALVASLLRHPGIVTLVGAGGIGKTTVALQVLSRMNDQSPHGSWLIDFATVKDADAVL